MKPSEYPKNKRDSLRVNTDIDAALRKAGWSSQKLYDWAVDKIAKIDTKITIKGEGRKK